MLCDNLLTMEGGERDNLGQDERQIGPLLEKKRTEKGLSLKDVEQATKIRTRYLEGLEREDFSMLPDHIYTRGFLKTYANFLGLDGERLSRELKERRSPRRERQFNYEESPANSFEQPLMSPGGIGVERRRVSGATVLTIALAVLVLAAVIGALYYIGTRSQPAETSAEDPAPAQEEEPAEEPAAAPETDRPAAQSADEPTIAPEAVPETVQVTVSVRDLPAGLTITADGSVVHDRFAQPGFSQTFEAKRLLSVSTSNAGSVEVEVDGQNIGRLGNYGQPVTREFSASPGG